MQKTSIAWTDKTWNPVHGCTKISEGCRHCYAEALSHRYNLTTLEWTQPNEALNIKLQYHKLNEPRKFKEPCRIFVNSMSDLFHPLVPDEFISKVFAVMRDCPQHTFQILTKRPERATTCTEEYTPNIWLGTSVENKKALMRIDSLRLSKAQVKFISAEPLLEDLGAINLSGIDWLIVGGESGANFRPMQNTWVENLMHQCISADVAFFFKQSAAKVTGKNPYLIMSDGSQWTWNQFPDDRKEPALVVYPRCKL